ncbi:MAG: glutaredoxin family protein [Sandaracinaceae bacterium]|nr:glutaredoxin family protein [Sandaracinaceae bacterium]
MRALHPPPARRPRPRRAARVRWLAALAAVAWLAACGPPAVPAATPSARAHVGVTLYSTRWCPHCAHVRDWLRARGIPFVDRDVERDPGAAAAHAQLEPRRTVPVVTVEGGAVVRGFVPDELRRRIDEAAHARCRAIPSAPGC